MATTSDPQTVDSFIEKLQETVGKIAEAAAESAGRLKESLEQAAKAGESLQGGLKKMEEAFKADPQKSPKVSASDKIEKWVNDRTESWAEGSDKKLTKFYDETLPNALGNASDAFADLFTGIARGTQSSSDLFKNLGASVMQVTNDIAADFMRVAMRFALFGSKEEGSNGLFGGLLNIAGNLIGSMFTGGYTMDMGVGGQATGLVDNAGAFLPQAKGGVFLAPALAAYSNSIVAGPTLFPFAKGGAFRFGLMGEAGAEAVMPLRRDSGGRLGVDASGIGGVPASVNNIIINTPPGTRAQTQEQRNNSGGMDTTVLIEMIDGAIAQGIASGRSKTANALKMRGA